jgi:hypothetical protein
MIMKTVMQLMKPLLVLAFIVLVEPGFSQRRPEPPQGRERIEVAKTTYLSRQMKLSPEEARQFWPVYDQYQEAVKALEDDRRKALQSMGEGLDNMNDDEINAMIDARIHHAELALAARKKMIAALREFLSPRKIAIFLRAENQFNRLLQKRLMERRNERLNPGFD